MDQIRNRARLAKRKGLLGIYIHNLKDKDGKTTAKGKNPFNAFNINAKDFGDIVKAYDPPHTDSQKVYDYIKEHLADWIEEAIEIRSQYD